jgi:5'-nucleotidase
VRGLEFRSGAATIDRWVPELRAAGADFVIVVAHAGAVCDEGFANCRGEAVDWAHAVTHRPDLIVGGHTHQVVDTRANGVTIVQSGSYGTRYVVVDLERIGRDSVDVWVRGIPAAYADVVAPDSTIAALVARYDADIADVVRRPVATIAERLDRSAGEYGLGRLIADAQRSALGTQLSIMNNGGIRAALPAGTVTWGALHTIQPFDNYLVRLTMTGAQLRTALEHAVSGHAPGAHVSGITVEYDPHRPVGRRIVRVVLDDGSLLDDERSYSVAVNDFLAGGEGDGFAVFGDALDRAESGIVDLDALVAHLQALPQPVRAPETPRFRAVTAGAP